MNRSGHPVIAFVGDVMLGRMVDAQIPTQAPEAFWGTARPLLMQADAVFANLECALTPATAPWKPREKVFHFKARPAAAAILRAGAIRCVSLANNHVLDFDQVGLLDTLACLDAAGIRRAGAGPTLAAAMAPAIVEAAGLRISFTALTDNEPDSAAGEDHPGVFHLDVEDRSRWDATLSAAARLAAAESPDLRVLSAHLGPNMVAEPSPLFQAFADAALDHGFDIYHGHSAHVLQGVRTRGGGLILHDTGDFLDDYVVDPVLRNDWSAIFLVEMTGAVPERLRIIPVELGFARVDLAGGAVAAAIAGRMIRQCRKLGTAAEAGAAGLTVRIPQARKIR